MKRLVLILMFGLTGCLSEAPQTTEDKSNGKDKKEPGNEYGIKDIFEYVNADGQCPGPDERFGDSTNGCVDFLQVTRFEDGSAYFTANLGHAAGVSWHWSKYLRTANGLYTDELHLGSGLRFKISLDLNGTTPLATFDYDHTGTYSDASSLSLTLTEVRL